MTPSSSRCVLRLPRVTRCALSNDGARILCEDGAIRSVPDGGVIAKCSRLFRNRLWYSFSPDGNVAAITDATGGRTALFDPSSGQAVAETNLRDDWMSGPAVFSLQGDRIMYGGRNRLCSVRIDDGAIIERVFEADDRVSRDIVTLEPFVAVSVVNAAGMTVYVLDHSLERDVQRVVVPDPGMLLASFDGRLAWASTSPGHAYSLDLFQGAVGVAVEFPLYPMRLSPDGAVAFGRRLDLPGSLGISMSDSSSIWADSRDVLRVAYSADSRFVAISFKEGTEVWRISN